MALLRLTPAQHVDVERGLPDSAHERVRRKMRAGYQELAAKGLMTLDELGARLDELESTRQAAQRELAALEGKRDELRTLERDAAALLETYENTIPERLDNLTPEERHQIYKLLQLKCLLTPDEPPELTGVFVANAPRVREIEGESRIIPVRTPIIASTPPTRPP